MHPSPVHLIICGAEKCGTTSVFGYLSAHPQVRASSTKETDYFRDPAASLVGYLGYFDRTSSNTSVLLESSPGYMAESEVVAPRLAKCVPSARLVFLLRDPIDRLRSSFRFYKSRLHVPNDMSFEAFVEICFAYEAQQVDPSRVGILAWHLGSLSRGRYEEQLANFSTVMPTEQLLVIHYDDLRDDVRGCVQRIAAFAGLDSVFFENFTFGRENVSFLARYRALQWIAIRVNDGLEPLWRRQPRLKRALLKAYKGMNERPLEPDPLTPATIQRLKEWYAPTYQLLAQLRPSLMPG